MTNLEISLKADQIKIEVDLIKRSNLPQAVKDLAILEAKRQIQSLKRELEFNKEYEDIKNYIQKGKEEMKESSKIFRKEFAESQDFCNSVKKEMEEARKNFFQNF
jgi:hypothetical protein|nr:MAG TPA: Topoisomerase I damage affected protein 11 [Caudoviricetes sp.]